MKWMLLASLAAALVAAACDSTGSADGARGPCAGGGQILGDCGEVETPEDACWKIVECGVFPVDAEGDRLDWGRCVDHIESYDDDNQAVVIACVAASSCDALYVNDAPDNPYEWPDCLEYR
jgi:hypothetical protein